MAFTTNTPAIDTFPPAAPALSTIPLPEFWDPHTTDPIRDIRSMAAAFDYIEHLHVHTIQQRLIAPLSTPIVANSEEDAALADAAAEDNRLIDIMIEQLNNIKGKV